MVKCLSAATYMHGNVITVAIYTLAKKHLWYVLFVHIPARISKFALKTTNTLRHSFSLIFKRYWSLKLVVLTFVFYSYGNFWVIFKSLLFDVSQEKGSFFDYYSPIWSKTGRQFMLCVTKQNAGNIFMPLAENTPSKFKFLAKLLWRFRENRFRSFTGQGHLKEVCIW